MMNMVTIYIANRSCNEINRLRVVVVAEHDDIAVHVTSFGAEMLRT
jgi:hypothetical protein